MKIGFDARDDNAISLANAAKFAGLEVVMYNNQAIYDFVDMFRPNIFVCAEKNLSDKHKQILIENGIRVSYIDGLANFGSLLTFQPVPYDESHMSDLLYISATEVSKDKIDKLVNYAREHKLKLKLVGNINLDYPEYLGVLTDLISLKKLVCSAKLVVVLDEALVNSYTLMKACVVSVDENIVDLLNNPEMIKTQSEIMYKMTIELNTEFHRLATVFEMLNEPSSAKLVMDSLCKLKN